jgi:hypothetical protein
MFIDMFNPRCCDDVVPEASDPDDTRCTNVHVFLQSNFLAHLQQPQPSLSMGKPSLCLKTNFLIAQVPIARTYRALTYCATFGCAIAAGYLTSTHYSPWFASMCW